MATDPRLVNAVWNVYGSDVSQALLRENNLDFLKGQSDGMRLSSVHFPIDVEQAKTLINQYIEKTPENKANAEAHLNNLLREQHSPEKKPAQTPLQRVGFFSAAKKPESKTEPSKDLDQEQQQHKKMKK